MSERVHSDVTIAVGAWLETTSCSGIPGCRESAGEAESDTRGGEDSLETTRLAVRGGCWGKGGTGREKWCWSHIVTFCAGYKIDRKAAPSDFGHDINPSQRGNKCFYSKEAGTRQDDVNVNVNL